MPAAHASIMNDVPGDPPKAKTNHGRKPKAEKHSEDSADIRSSREMVEDLIKNKLESSKDIFMPTSDNRKNGER